MYFKEYILPLWYLSFPLIFLLVGIYCFLYRILVARKFKDKKRIKGRPFGTLYLFISGLLFIFLPLYNNNNGTIFAGIVSIAVVLYLYDYDFILNEGLLINGKYITWDKIHSWDYKNNKDILILKYFKNNNDKKLSKVKFNIISNLRFEFEIMLKDKVNNKNIKNDIKVHSNKNIKIGLSLSLIIVTMVSVYGFYNLVQPKTLGEVLEKTFNHREISYVNVSYERDLTLKKIPAFDMSITSDKEKVKELTTYLNSLYIRKIRHKALRYNYFNRDLYRIKLRESNWDKVEILISTKEPIIEIIRNNKERSYFIDTKCNYVEFMNKFIKSSPRVVSY